MKLQGNFFGHLRAWLELVRLPNLLTVPGDVCVGMVVATTGSYVPGNVALPAVVAGLSLYIAGLIMNDVVDLPLDRRERPGRPLARGEIAIASAKIAIMAFLSLALIQLAQVSALALVVGIVLGALILFYNVQARRHRLLAAVVMGACRAGNLALGMAVVAPTAMTPAMFVVVFMWMLYIGATSWLASREVKPGPYGNERWWPASIVVGGAMAILFMVPAISGQAFMRAGFGFIFALLLAYQAGLMLGFAPRRPTPSIYPAAIGRLISALMPIQAAMLVLVGSEPWTLLVALLLLFGWPVNRWLAKRFAPS